MSLDEGFIPSGFESENGGGPVSYSSTYRLEVLQNISSALWDEADITITSTNSNELANVINNADPDSIIEVKTGATYSQIVIPTDKKLIVRSALGYSPILSDAGALVLSDGVKDFFMSGFRFENCTPFGDPNSRGEAITMGADKSNFENIIFNNCYFGPANTGSMVMLAYHWAPYHSNQSVDDLSNKAAFVSCQFFEACKNDIEGGGLNVRAVNRLLVDDCIFDGGDYGRCTHLQNIKNAEVINNKLHHSGSRECIKLDMMGITLGSFTTTGLVANNEVWAGDEGIDLDDTTEVFAIYNYAHDCRDGIVVDDTGRANIISNICENNSGAGFK